MSAGRDTAVRSFALRLLMTVCRAMPRVPGAGRMCNWLIKFYLVNRDPGRISVRAYGYDFEVDPKESVSQRALTFFPQLYDRREFAFMAEVLSPGGCFVDIGAHIGVYSILAARSVGDAGRVLAVEAAPRTAVLLRKHIELNDLSNILTREVGVTDKLERLSLDPNPSNSGGDRLGAPTGEALGIECVPLLDLLMEAGINSVTVMKLDIEGFEHRVLHRFLADAPRGLWPEHVIVEAHAVKSGDDDPVEVLSRHGYRLAARSNLNRMLSLA